MNRTFENIRNNHADRIETAEMYDKEYFEKHDSPPYKRSEARWLNFFNRYCRRAGPKSQTSHGIGRWLRHRIFGGGVLAQRSPGLRHRSIQLRDPIRFRKISKDSAL